MRPAISSLVSLSVLLCVLVLPAVVWADESEPLVVHDGVGGEVSQPPKPESPESPVPIYVGPRLGPSMVTGYLGIEAQYGHHFALGGGLLFDDGYAVGIKYLISPDPASIYLFGSYLYIKAYEGDGADEPPSKRIITNMGVGVGWQKRWQNGFIASVGVGPSYYDDPNSDSHLMFVLDLSIGYAFGFRNQP